MQSTGGSWSILAIVAGTLAVPSFAAESKPLDPEQATPEFHQRSWRYEHGLPTGDRVYAIVQTRDGYLWTGSQYGLARFDGRSFTVFDHISTPELANDDCRTLAADVEGPLWIGTKQNLLRKSGMGFASFRDKIGRHFMPYPPLCASRTGGVWVGGTDSVYRIRGDTVTFYSREQTLSPASGFVTSLKEAENDFLWVGTTVGLERLDIRRGRFERGSDNHAVFAIWTAPSGQLWLLSWEFVANPGGPVPKTWLGCLDKGQWPKAPSRRELRLDSGWQGRFLVGANPNLLWLPAGFGGIHRYRNGALEFVPMPQQSKDDGALTAFMDRESNLWVGTDKTGLQCWTARRIFTVTSKDGLVDDNAWSIYETSDGGLLVGTDGGVTCFKDGKVSTLARPDGSAYKDVRAVAQDLEGAIWVGTMRSLECVRAGINQPVELPGEWFEAKIRALHPGRDGSMWVGTVRGLTRFHKGQRTKYTANEGLGSDEVRAILESRTGDVWVGTLGGGLSRFHDGQFTTIKGLSSNNVWALHEDADGILWIGTDNGLSCIQKGVIKSYTKADGLPETLVNCVISDDFGQLWIGHDRGIYSLKKKQLQETIKQPGAKVEAARYDDSDGLLSVETNGQKSNPTACKTRDGRLWFPTTKGVAVLDPAKLTDDEVAPLAAIEEVRANGKPVLGQNDFHLEPGGARVLEFRYTANTFVAPEKAHFKYRLIGTDESWIDAGTRREAYFTDMHPGSYRFEVIAGNHRGLWQQHAASVGFYVAPFYYETWWFYTACGTSVAVLAGLAGAWRLRELRRIHTLERVNALNEQRRQIARDIHDELGASLTHIMRLSERARPTDAQPDATRAPFERITSIASEAVDNINEIVWANNPEYDTLEDLAAYLREHAANFFADTSIQVRFDFPETVPSRPVTGLFRRHVVLLMKEALQNVYKHAQARHVNVRLGFPEGLLELCITDDGRGFDEHQTRFRGNGLVNMRQRVSELKGALSINSLQGEGTEIHVRLPIAGARS